MSSFQRQTAVPCRISELREGEWQQNPGMQPSGILTPRGFVARTSIFGVVIQRQQNSFVMEDGTGHITIRSFDLDKEVLVSTGQIVLVIGRPREFNDQRYVVLEICKELPDRTWIEYRKKELEHLESPAALPVAREEEVPKTIEVPENPFERLIETIRNLDDGSGAAVGDVLRHAGTEEKYLNTLIEEGEVFEIRPGQLKVLE